MSWLKKNSSVVWKYFKKDVNNSNEAQCLICKSSYKRSNGTSNLMEHLKRKHMGILDRDNMLLQNEEQDSINEPGYLCAFKLKKHIIKLA